MSWKVNCVMDERLKFVAAVLDEEASMAVLCRKFGISRKTGYKWLARYECEGPPGLLDRSRAPHHSPHKVDEAMRKEIVAYKKNRLLEGPKKVRVGLQRLHPEVNWPAASTIGAILDEENLVKRRRQHPKASPSTTPLAHSTAANTVWCADFKGWFLTQDRRRCTPLTMQDAFSRFLLCCRGMGGRTGADEVRPYFEWAFREFGLPDRLRTDNGPPFASVGLGGLTALSIWWMRLGIVLERIAPGHPEQNGRLERFHRTLKEATAMPPARNLREQQRAFNAFTHYYNHERPHEALGQQPPSSAFEPSLRPFPERLPNLPEYPGDWQVRRVKSGGWIKWQGLRPYVSEALQGQFVALEPVGEGAWTLYFIHTPLAQWDEGKGRFRRLGKKP